MQFTVFLAIVLMPSLGHSFCFHCFFKQTEREDLRMQVYDVANYNRHKPNLRSETVSDQALQMERDKLSCLDGIRKGNWLACTGRSIAIVLPHRFNRFNPVG